MPSLGESVERTRREGRLGLRDVPRHGAHGTIALNGTEESEQGTAILVALTRIDGQPYVLVGRRDGAVRTGHRLDGAPGESGIVHHVVAEVPGEDVESRVTAVVGRVAQELVRLTG